MYNLITDEWTELPDMQKTRFGHGCGIARTSQGMMEVVAAGGLNENTVEIFSFLTNTWRYFMTRDRKKSYSWWQRQLFLGIKKMLTDGKGFFE